MRLMYKKTKQVINQKSKKYIKKLSNIFYEINKLIIFFNICVKILNVICSEIERVFNTYNINNGYLKKKY